MISKINTLGKMMAFLNPELVQSSEQIERLREMELAMLVEGQRWQSLKVDNEIEKMRLPVAFADILYRQEYIKKTLYLTTVPSVKNSVEHSFKLHTVFKSIFIKQIKDIDDMEENLVLSSLVEFLDGLISAEQAEQFLSHFDLVIIEYSDLKMYDLATYRLKNLYRGLVLELIYKPQVLNL